MSSELGDYVSIAVAIMVMVCGRGRAAGGSRGRITRILL